MSARAGGGSRLLTATQYETETRAFEAEVANLLGELTHQILWDIEKFFDSVPALSVINKAVEFQYALVDILFYLNLSCSLIDLLLFPYSWRSRF